MIVPQMALDMVLRDVLVVRDGHESPVASVDGRRTSHLKG